MKSEGIAIIAKNVTTVGPNGPVFESVSVEISAGTLGVVVGSSGAGRTSLLLAFAGRMKVVAGQLTVGGLSIPQDAARVRGLVALARAEPAYRLDPRLRVRELITERRLIGGKHFTAANLAAASDLLGIDPPPKAFVGDLAPAQQILFATALAASEEPGAVVVDDADMGCTAEEREYVWDALQKLTFRGFTVLASSTSPPPFYDRDAFALIELVHPSSRRVATDNGEGDR